MLRGSLARGERRPDSPMSAWYHDTHVHLWGLYICSYRDCCVYAFTQTFLFVLVLFLSTGGIAQAAIYSHVGNRSCLLRI